MRLIITLFVLGAAACATTAGGKDDLGHGITFIEDDYAAALAQARERDVPLFVDAWAPWCHSCVFLREHVMHDPALQHNEKRYVFLSIDTEKEKNAAFLEKYPVDTWPTLFIIEPKSEKAVLKWLGTGTVAQLEKLLDDGEVAAKGGEDLLAVADRLYADGKDAADAYRAALGALPEDHPRRSRTIESLLNVLYKKDQPACAAAGVEYAPKMERGPSFVNTVALSMACAEGAQVKDAIAAIEPLAVEALKLDGILADDKSGIYELLIELREGDAKKALALEWLSFLEGEAAKAATPAARAVFDPHRLNAALAAGAPMKVEGALLQSEKDLPGDYNPPARLAIVYREAGRYDDALAAIERGMTRAYGPRKMRLYEIKASILGKKGDAAGQRVVFLEAVAYGRSLPAAQRPEKTIARLEGEAKKLEGK